MSGGPRFSFLDRIRSFRYAIQGLVFLVQSQHNARIHLVLTVLVIGAGIVLKISATDWSLLLICMSAVWAAEAFNTAVECLTDLVCQERHPLAGRAKDLAAAAVLITAFSAAIVGGLIFFRAVSD